MICKHFFPAQEQMSDSEGEDRDDIDTGDLFDEPQIEQNLRELDNNRQQQITVTAEVHAHVDEVNNNRLHSLLYTFISFI